MNVLVKYTNTFVVLLPVNPKLSQDYHNNDQEQSRDLQVNMKPKPPTTNLVWSMRYRVLVIQTH